jgi:iron complex outermembrane recepter protein
MQTRRTPEIRRFFGFAVALGFCVQSGAEPAPPSDGLAELSLEELSNLEVTSVSKSAESLRQAPASIYVITHDEILRSGVTSVSEALRLAPNLQITQYTSSRYVAGARGFAGAESAQNFSNKLLILIDGRSVYSPLYSGVYLDVQDVLMDDIDRIEVISGPGATLWGANAMNGVINIITRPAYLTDSGLVTAGAGSQERNASARFGKKLSEALSFRVYGKAFEQDAMDLADGRDAGDDWHKAQAGFRMDWTGADDSATVQGDAYRGTQNVMGPTDGRIEGANVLGRWQHRTDHGDWQVQAYYDRTERTERPSGVGFELDTFDLELQHAIQLGAHRVIWGAGARFHDYQINNSATLIFDPSDRELHLGNLFAQDTIALTDQLDLTLGLKMERDSFSGWNPLPDIRLAWRVTDEALLWLAASRAIRSPTPFDRDVIEKQNDAVLLMGNKSFDPERVDTYEVGYRAQPTSNLSLSASVFYNVYEDLRTIELTPVTVFPLTWGNLMEGETYGLEVWAKWQVTDWWRLAPGVRLLRKSLEFSPGASGLLGLDQSGNDPKSQALLTSSMDFGPQLTFDATFRYVDALPNPKLHSYYELNASLGWHVWRALDVSISGFNLLDSRHLEYAPEAGEYIRRSVIAQARWRF